MTDREIQKAFAQWTLNMEARRDSDGKLVVYRLPGGDGGGDFEVAGINDRYHPRMARTLRAMILRGEHDEAEIRARDYLENYTDAVNEWHPDEVVEGYLRCCAFNRGPKGAAWILQYALRYGFSPSLYSDAYLLDGEYGRVTRRGAYSVAAQDPEKMLFALFGARAIYERTPTAWKGSRDEGSIFWHGLYRRFVEDSMFAISLAGQ